MILGFDISTTCIGISIYSNEGVLQEVTHLEIKANNDISEDNRYLYKANSFKDKITEIISDKTITKVFVESPLKNANKIDTVMKLARFNGVCCYIIKEITGFDPIMLDVKTIRQTLCPEFVRVDKKPIKNPKFLKEIRKKDYRGKIPKTCNTPAKKHKYILQNINPEFEHKPTIHVIDDIFSYPKELDIKQHILNKIANKYKFFKDSLEYNKKGKLEKFNFDRSDACAVVEAGLILESKNKNNE